MHSGRKKQSPGSSGRLFFAFLLLMATGTLVSSDGIAQSVAERKTTRVDTSRNIEARLVELALQEPGSEVLQHQTNIARYQVKSAKNSWFNLLTVSANYNDQTFKPIDNSQTQTYVYPKYFFGLNIPVGLFFTKGAEIKVARENLKIALNNQQRNKGTIRVNVLSKYKQYLALTEQLVLQEDVIAEVSAVYTQMEKKFSDGAVSLDVYNAASKRYNDELSKRINLKLDRDIVQLEIESMIGVPLESVIKR
jgi:outer membrane protein TolC